MLDKYYIGWVRDEYGTVLHRPRNSICNAITSFVGGGKFTANDGLAPTAPHVVYCFE